MKKRLKLKSLKWLILYILLIYSTLSVVPFFTGLMYRIGLDWIIRYGPGVIISFIFLYYIYKLFISSSYLHLTIILIILLLASGYCYFLYILSDHPIERIHLLEYGILSIIIVKTLEESYPRPRLILYTIGLVLIVGFADEVLQGFLPGRYYDLRDIILNLSSGIFGLGMLFVYRAMHGHQYTLINSKSSSKSFRLHDAVLLSSVTLAICFIVFIEKKDVSQQKLLGKWERSCSCGGIEGFIFTPEGQFIWEDTNGNYVYGSYKLKGNRLEGTRIFFEMKDGRNLSKCGLRYKGKKISSVYLKIYPDYFYFDQHQDRPWFKVNDLQD